MPTACTTQTHPWQKKMKKNTKKLNELSLLQQTQNTHTHMNELSLLQQTQNTHRHDCYITSSTVHTYLPRDFYYTVSKE